jgi:hypothetical protein
VEISAAGEANGLGHHEWLGLLLDREVSWRRDKRLSARLRAATYADANLDRLVHNAHRVELTGESLRRTRGKQAKTA